MADLGSVQTFATPSFNVQPVVKQNQQGGVTPLSMLELANTARSVTALAKDQALLEPAIQQGIAQSKKEVLSAEKAGVDLQQHYADISRSVYGGLLTDPDFINGKSDAMIEKLNKSKEFLHSIGVPEINKGQAHKDLVALAKENPGQATQFIKNIVQQGVSNATQAAELNKAPTYLNLGNRVQAQPTTPYQGVNPNATYATGLAPQVFANQITGAPMVIGGGGGGAPQGQVAPQGGASAVPQQAPQTAPTSGAPSAQTKPSQASAVAQSSGFVQGANEPKEAFIARASAPQASYAKAQDQFNNPNSEFGHIPTIKNINSNIMRYLKDPKVDTGAVQSYLAGKTNKGSLSADEQELAKFLEQRIQNLSAKSDRDADSKRTAYGSIGMKKEALMELVRNDNAWVTQQELLAKGALNNGGAGANPNYVKVDAFNKQFSQLSQNPNLMKYISLVGENPDRIAIDKDDYDAARKYFGKMTEDERNKLEMQRKTLLRLVEGK